MSYRAHQSFPCSDVVIKLGLTKGTKPEFSLFRRVSPQQLFSQGKDGVSVLKTHSVQLYLSCFEEPVDFSLDNYSVTLTYVDSDQDTVLIHSKEDLVEAMHEHRSSRKKSGEKLKILATVQEKKTTKADMQEDSSRASSKSESATQTPVTRKTPVATQTVFVEEAAVADSVTTQTTSVDEAHVAAKQADAVADPASLKKAPSPASLKKAPSTSSNETPLPIQEAVEALACIMTKAANTLHDHVSKASANRSAGPTVVTEATDKVEEKEMEEPALFIHGRHTCDACLTTPIVGKRFHAVNLPDYDLCAACMENYKGSEIQFEEQELDRDHIFQERWRRRHAKMTGMRGGRRGCPRSPRCGPSGGHHRRGRYGPPGPPAPFGPPPHGPPPPFGPPPHGPPPPFGPPPHGPPPPFAPHPHGPPPPFAPHGPPPPFGPHGPRFHGRAHPSGPHFSGPPASTMDIDFALKEAIRRSMEDLKKSEKSSQASTEKSASTESTTKEEELQIPPQEETAQSASNEKEDLLVTAEEATAKSATSDKSDLQIPVEEATEPSVANKEEEFPVPNEEATEASVSSQEEDSHKTDNKAEQSPRNGKAAEFANTYSFASDAAGYGDVAEGMGETLDLMANAIDDLRVSIIESNDNEYILDSGENSDDEYNVEEDAVLDAECTIVNSEDANAGATIVDGEDCEEVASHNSWQVVAEENQIAHDEALARAAQVIGSALFSSDMARSHGENVSTLTRESGVLSHQSSPSSSVSSADSHVSSIMSVPTTVPSLGGTNGRVPTAQLERWSIQLAHLHELGFYDDVLTVEILERLSAANIGVDSSDEVTVHQVINEMMKNW